MSDAPGAIVVVGAHCPGLFIRVHAVPRPGETVLGWHLDEPRDGGKATNQAVAAARLGAPVTFVSLVGDDERGHDTRRWLREEGIDVEHLMQEPGATDVGFVILADDGVPAIVSAGDRSAGLTAERIEPARRRAARRRSSCASSRRRPRRPRRRSAMAREGAAVDLLNPAPAAPLDAGAARVDRHPRPQCAGGRRARRP